MLWRPTKRERLRVRVCVGSDLNAAPLGSFTRIPERTCDVDLFGQRHVALAHGRQHGGVVHQPADVVVHHGLPEVLVVQDVGEDERPYGGHACTEVRRSRPRRTLLNLLVPKRHKTHD